MDVIWYYIVLLVKEECCHVSRSVRLE